MTATLVVCLVGIVIQNLQALLPGNGLEAFGPDGLVLPDAVFLIALFLAWFAAYSSRRSWLS